jgi:hypothetical protein
MQCVLSGHWSFLTSVIFNGDDSCVASSSEDGTIRIWDVENGEPIVNMSFNTNNALQDRSRLQVCEGVGQKREDGRGLGMLGSGDGGRGVGRDAKRRNVSPFWWGEMQKGKRRNVSPFWWGEMQKGETFLLFAFLLFGGARCKKEKRRSLWSMSFVCARVAA